MQSTGGRVPLLRGRPPSLGCLGVSLRLAGLLHGLTTPVNCGILKKRRRPALDASQKQIITMGKTEEPIGSRRESRPPHGLRRRRDRPHNRFTLYLSGIIQDFPSFRKRHFPPPILYILCVYEGKNTVWQFRIACTVFFCFSPRLVCGAERPPPQAGGGEIKTHRQKMTPGADALHSVQGFFAGCGRG